MTKTIHPTLLSLVFLGSCATAPHHAAEVRSESSPIPQGQQDYEDEEQQEYDGDAYQDDVQDDDVYGTENDDVGYVDASYRDPYPSMAPGEPAGPAYLNEGSGAGGGDGWSWRIGADLVTTESADGPEEDIDFDEGYGLSVGVLRRFASEDGDAWAYDLGIEGFWTDQDADDDDIVSAVRDVNTTGLMFEGIADYALSDRSSLYAGAGLGAAWVDVGQDSGTDFDEDDGPFLAWQIKLGARWDLSTTTALDVGYRLRNIDDVELDDDGGGLDDASFDLETQQHMLGIGIRFLL